MFDGAVTAAMTYMWACVALCQLRTNNTITEQCFKWLLAGFTEVASVAADFHLHLYNPDISWRDVVKNTAVLEHMTALLSIGVIRDATSFNITTDVALCWTRSFESPITLLMCTLIMSVLTTVMQYTVPDVPLDRNEILVMTVCIRIAMRAMLEKSKMRLQLLKPLSDMITRIEVSIANMTSCTNEDCNIFICSLVLLTLGLAVFMHNPVFFVMAVISVFVTSDDMYVKTQLRIMGIYEREEDNTSNASTRFILTWMYHNTHGLLITHTAYVKFGMQYVWWLCPNTYSVLICYVFAPTAISFVTSALWNSLMPMPIETIDKSDPDPAAAAAPDVSTLVKQPSNLWGTISSLKHNTSATKIPKLEKRSSSSDLLVYQSSSNSRNFRNIKVHERAESMQNLNLKCANKEVKSTCVTPFMIWVLLIVFVILSVYKLIPLYANVILKHEGPLSGILMWSITQIQSAAEAIESIPWVVPVVGVLTSASIPTLLSLAIGATALGVTTTVALLGCVAAVGNYVMLGMILTLTVSNTYLYTLAPAGHSATLQEAIHLGMMQHAHITRHDIFVSSFDKWKQCNDSKMLGKNCQLAFCTTQENCTLHTQMNESCEDTRRMELCEECMDCTNSSSHMTEDRIRMDAFKLDTLQSMYKAQNKLDELCEYVKDKPNAAWELRKQCGPTRALLSIFAPDEPQPPHNPEESKQISQLLDSTMRTSLEKLQFKADNIMEQETEYVLNPAIFLDTFTFGSDLALAGLAAEHSPYTPMQMYGQMLHGSATLSNSWAAYFARNAPKIMKSYPTQSERLKHMIKKTEIDAVSNATLAVRCGDELRTMQDENTRLQKKVDMLENKMNELKHAASHSTAEIKAKIAEAEARAAAAEARAAAAEARAAAATSNAIAIADEAKPTEVYQSSDNSAEIYAGCPTEGLFNPFLCQVATNLFRDADSTPSRVHGRVKPSVV